MEAQQRLVPLLPNSQLAGFIRNGADIGGKQISHRLLRSLAQQHKTDIGVELCPEIQGIHTASIGPAPHRLVNVGQQQVDGHLLPQTAGHHRRRVRLTHTLVPNMQTQCHIALQRLCWCHPCTLQSLRQVVKCWRVRARDADGGHEKISREAACAMRCGNQSNLRCANSILSCKLTGFESLVQSISTSMAWGL